MPDGIAAVTATIVGSGELIVTPKLGASAGFTLLWFIIVGCLLKVFIQIELGRHAVARGATSLESMNLMPGPRVVVSWLLWLWLIMFAGTVFQVAGMLGVSESTIEKDWVFARAWLRRELDRETGG